ncbi:MAG: nucleotidyltransferase domain-containing protein [Spirochaetales bacterium]|nr:nucleotidyltransferase domain-containing protein [Spirochaetales bacterium]
MSKKKITDARVFYISDQLKTLLKSNLKLLILFGSRARGNYTEYSDYDLLIVLKNKSDDLIDEIRDIEVEFLNKYNVLSAALIYTEVEWEKRKKIPIGINIMREGVCI